MTKITKSPKLGRKKKKNEMETKERQLKHKKPNKAALKIGDTNLHFQKFLIKYFQKLPFIK